MLVADFIGVFALFDWLADFKKTGDEREERCGVLVIGQIGPVLGGKLHGFPEALPPFPDLVVIGFPAQLGEAGMVSWPALLKIRLDGLASRESSGAGILQPVVIGKVGQLGPQVPATQGGPRRMDASDLAYARLDMEEMAAQPPRHATTTYTVRAEALTPAAVRAILKKRALAAADQGLISLFGDDLDTSKNPMIWTRRECDGAGRRNLSPFAGTFPLIFRFDGPCGGHFAHHAGAVRPSSQIRRWKL